jgi:hypothetical protein
MRSNERRDDAPANGGRDKDPLAELARLIGQDDPFTVLGHPVGRTQPRPKSAEPYEDARQTAPQWPTRPARRQTEPDPSYEEQAAEANPHHFEAAKDGGRRQNDPRYSADDPEAYADVPYDWQGPYDAERYEEPPTGRRRGGIVTLAAVVGVALVGAAGIFGYQALAGLSSSPRESPVIKAEQTPTEVVPVAPSTDNGANTQIDDRVGGRGGEGVVPREEQPVDPRDAVRAAAPATAAPAPAGATGSVLPTAPAPPPGLVESEPKKVKTETIQPNQVAAPPPASPSAPVANMAPPALASAAPAATSAAHPLSVAPARAANAETGKYVVQVASQRSEADAQGSFRALQHKYPGMLGRYKVMVRRADLGDKGVFYRVQVGPFATAKQANEMCSSLKSAGGQCILQKN